MLVIQQRDKSWLVARHAKERTGTKALCSVQFINVPLLSLSPLNSFWFLQISGEKLSPIKAFPVQPHNPREALFSVLHSLLAVYSLLSVPRQRTISFNFNKHSGLSGLPTHLWEFWQARENKPDFCFYNIYTPLCSVHRVAHTRFTKNNSTFMQLTLKPTFVSFVYVVDVNILFRWHNYTLVYDDELS